jgi:glycosyltransferase involved in cell wall biosynthesis
VLLLAPLPPPVGGMAVYTETLLGSPVADAFEINLLQPDLLRKHRFSGVCRQAANLLNCTLVTGKLLLLLLWFRPAVVHIMTSSFAGFFERSFYAVLARLLGRKVVMHIHGGAFCDFYNTSSRLLQRLIRLCLRAGHRTVAVSDGFRSFFVSLGIPDRRAVLLRNAVHLPPARTMNDDQTTITVLFLNRIEAAKGVQELIEAAGRLCPRFPELRFVITGPDCGGVETVEHRAIELGIARQVEICAPVTGDDKDAAYQGADIYVLASHIEGMPLGLLEAMAYGLACITCPVGGIGEVISDGENGLLVPARDQQALTAAIERLVRDRSLRQRLGAAARRTIEQGLGWDRHAASLIGLYRELLSEDNRSTS